MSLPSTSALFRPRPRASSCGCGRTYSARNWQALAYVGVQDLGDGTVCELRNCACGSTLSAPPTAPLILVGEDNPYGADPYFALFPIPRQASSNRLRLRLGLSDVAYFALRRVNLCSGKFDAEEARAAALGLIERRHPTLDWLLLLGKKVATAFGFDEKIFPPFAFLSAHRIALLPHPSGRCRAWQEPGAESKLAGVLAGLETCGALKRPLEEDA